MCRAADMLFGEGSLVSGCSRTDSGVHALDYAATLQTDSATVIPPEKLPSALNTFLPDDISVHSACVVDDGYSVRRHTLGKEYMYVINTAKYPDPFCVGRIWHYGHGLDTDKMKSAAGAIIGRHDFSAVMASGSDVTDTVRTVDRCDVIRQDDVIRIYVSADGFLYNMVRIIVGTLTEIGSGRRCPDEMAAIIDSRDRSSAGITAPADGLYLHKVFLDNIK